MANWIARNKKSDTKGQCNYLIQSTKPVLKNGVWVNRKLHGCPDRHFPESIIHKLTNIHLEPGQLAKIIGKIQLTVKEENF